jgi:hypothetical protein
MVKRIILSAITVSLLFLAGIINLSCLERAPQQTHTFNEAGNAENRYTQPPFDTTTKSIHVFVALCDNKYQGIVPVPDKIGNGQDPDNNLYWGWAYGVRTYFKKSKEWKFLESRRVDSTIHERLIFKHTKTGYFLVADAYDGKYIRNCTIDFLNGASGQTKDTVLVKDQVIGINGNAKLLSLIGHNGLMDFQLPSLEQNTDNKKRDCIILACISKKYFTPHLNKANANPVLWTSGLMGPEAYTLHDALSAYVDGKSNEIIRTKAAEVYSKYTKCSLRAAKNLLVTGW